MQNYVDLADQIIIDGEGRICRLTVLSEAMSDSACATIRIDTMMAKHAELLRSWDTRRFEMIARLETTRPNAEWVF